MHIYDDRLPTAARRRNLISSRVRACAPARSLGPFPQPLLMVELLLKTVVHYFMVGRDRLGMRRPLSLILNSHTSSRKACR